MLGTKHRDLNGLCISHLMSLNRNTVEYGRKVGPSEYKKCYGELDGNPRDNLAELSDQQPRTFDVLRLGTT